MRGQLAGWKCYYVPGAIARHARVHASPAAIRKFKAYHVERQTASTAPWKLLPSFILLMSPLFTVNRYLAAEFYAARDAAGDSRPASHEGTTLVDRAAGRASAGPCGRARVHLPEMIRQATRHRAHAALSVDEWYRLISRFKLDAIRLALKY